MYSHAMNQAAKHCKLKLPPKCGFRFGMWSGLFVGCSGFYTDHVHKENYKWFHQWSYQHLGDSHGIGSIRSGKITHQSLSQSIPGTQQKTLHVLERKFFTLQQELKCSIDKEFPSYFSSGKRRSGTSSFWQQ